ncbi:UPF0187-domain-containing protein [Tricholoma matsutake]|nr:UPF0187-domain-containing protein [Tricholoma matsutake 945]
MTIHQLVFSNQLLTVLGTVLGLVISFRTSSAYERYQDGRKMWSNITIASRNLAQMVWIHVPFELPNAVSQKGSGVLRGVIEKKTMINLIQAFSVSLKHFLRGEAGVYYRDLYPLVCFLPRYANMHEAHREADKLPLWHASDSHPYEPGHEHADNVRSAADQLGHHPERVLSLPTHLRDNNSGSDDTKSETRWFRSPNNHSNPPAHKDVFEPEKVLPEVHSDRHLRPARMPPQSSIYDYIPLLRFFRWLFRVILRRAHPPSGASRRKKKNRQVADSNVPLEIILVLSSYTGYLMKNNLVQPAIASNMTTIMTSLQDTMTNLERIRNTPLPFAYQAHLRMSLWLYLFFLPFQIYVAFGYLTIPATAFTSFLLLGFLEIGQEIENPFNYDLNDLDLDNFCLALQRELHEITAHTNADPSTFVFSAWNQPFAPSDRRTAENLLKSAEEYRLPDHRDGPEPGLASIRSTLVKNWRDVEEITRQN